MVFTGRVSHSLSIRIGPIKPPTTFGRLSGGRLAGRRYCDENFTNDATISAERPAGETVIRERTVYRCTGALQVVPRALFSLPSSVLDTIEINVIVET